jgi:diguanylate cyclase (GGDEF)-like protein/PAS domain S-box-containing protein
MMMTTAVQELLPNIADFLPDAIFLVDRAGVIVYVSRGCEAMLGYRPDEMIGRPMPGFQAPEDRERTAEEVCRVLAEQARTGFENRYIHKNGHYVHLMWSTRWLPSHELRLGVARDISRRKEVEQRQAATYAISEAAQRATDLSDLCALVHAILKGFVAVAAFAVVVAVPGQDEVAVIYQAGPTPSKKRLLQWYRELGQADGAGASQDCATFLGHEWLGVQLIAQGASLGAIFLRHLARRHYSSDDKAWLRFVSAQVALAVERQILHADLLRAARYDDLTGLPNRRLFQERLKSALARSRRLQTRIGLLFADIDHFKQVNDTFGHAVGDLLLQEIAKRLTRCARESDTVARLGGDEFVLLVEDLQSVAAAERIAEKIRAIASVPVTAAGLSLHVTLSVGVAIYPDHAEQADELLRCADSGMYAAKHNKRSM